MNKYYNEKEGNYYLLKLQFIDVKEPYLLDVSSLMYDLVLVHDFGIILTEKEYADYEFSHFFWNKNGRPIKQNHKVRTARIVKESPLFLEIIVRTIEGIQSLLDIIEKIQNWSLNKKKLKLEVEKLGYETQLKKMDLEDRSKKRQVEEYRLKLINRLEQSSFRLSDIEVRKY